MGLSIKRLRWVLAAVALLLVVVLVAYIGYGRWRALRNYADFIKRHGGTISRDTNGVTYSQTEQGRTVFTLHANRTTQLDDGHIALHGVDVTVYGRMANRADRIYGDEFTYDQKQGIVRALGDVHMDLQAPQSLTSAGRSAPPATAPSDPRHESEEVIHVRTSGLVYLKSLGVAATDQPVEFRYGGIEGTSQGAEFNSGQSTLRLLADVVANGLVRGEPVTLHATRADIDRVANVANLEAPRAVSNGRTARADRAVLNLRKDGSIASAHATGGVQLNAETRQLNAAALDVNFTQQTVAQTGRLSGGVQLTDANPLRPLQGSAASADIVFDARGVPASILANGVPGEQARFALSDKRDDARGLQRSMHGDRILALFVSAPGRGGPHQSPRLSKLHASGSAASSGESIASTARSAPVQRSGTLYKTTTLSADDLQLSFVAAADGKAEPRHLTATGHTLLEQDTPLPAGRQQETSAGDALDADFSRAVSRGRSQLTIASALQTGHVVVHRSAPARTQANGSQPAQMQFATGTADRASYDGVTEKLTLSGSTHLTQDNMAISAASVTLDDRTQDADATGNVQATIESSPSNSSSNTAAARPPQYTHVLSATAHFNHDARQAEFRGSDAQPAKIWQEASQVQAATLVLDSLHHTFSARPAAAGARIHATFAGTSTTASSAKRPVAGRASYVRVAAARMEYNDLDRVAVFTSVPLMSQGVELDGDAGTVHAQRATAYLVPATSAAKQPQPQPTPVGGSLDRIVVAGEVELDQPGRHGTGEQLVYTAVTGDSVLTGTPSHAPRIVDAQQGSIAGPRLLFGGSGSTIVVSGEESGGKVPAGTVPGSKGQPVRVHTETHLDESKPGKAKQ